MREEGSAEWIEPEHGAFDHAACRPQAAIFDPRTGQPVGADDKYFFEINSELSDKGFFVMAADT